MTASVISVEEVSKNFGRVRALSNVSFSVAQGEIRAVCGENGAGKSTLVKMLMGIVDPDAGAIRIDGQAVRLRGAQHAQSLGLGLVAQELSLAPLLSIVDNIWLGSNETPLIYRIGSLRERARAAMESLGAGDVDLSTPVASLPIGQRQIVEIARLIARNARVLILDEPTATLSDAEIERLMGVLKRLRAQGRSIIYISHRLGEVFDLCDTVTVLRNGAHVDTRPVSTVTRDSLIEMMLGRPFSDMYPPSAPDIVSGDGLRVEGLTVSTRVNAVSFVAPAGRITCLVGQIGSGASLVNRALAGLEPEAQGRVTLGGRPLPLGSAAAAIGRNILFVSDDRAAEGLFPDLDVLANLVAADLKRHTAAGVLSWPRLRATGMRIASDVGVDPARLKAAAGQLSGGNQQKLLFGRALAWRRPGVLLMNEPTRGIDVGARADIYRLMRDLCARGWTLIMTSSELEEVVGMADIAYTLYRGRIIRRHERPNIETATILAEMIHPTVPERAQ